MLICFASQAFGRVSLAALDQPSPLTISPIKRWEIQKVRMPQTSWRAWSYRLPIIADIVKILESQPDLANKLRRVRGGYLKMQGTWMARDVSAVFLIWQCDASALLRL